MITAYLDTSAAMKLIVEEVESEALSRELASGEDRRLVSSWLLHTEMHCAAGRHPDAVEAASVQAVLEVVNLVDLTRGDLLAAGTHAPLRSNDAIHLAVALRLGCEELVVYDEELAAAAGAAGLSVLSPGR
ncbi:MAG TPA: type II toxin-antitoxin system VapC family toxin [Solirubrobacterales bacterium]|nr:type II toxin-antitoxin system VapC family toxin [Solirubrobacterales bacterium]